MRNHLGPNSGPVWIPGISVTADGMGDVGCRVSALVPVLQNNLKNWLVYIHINEKKYIQETWLLGLLCCPVHRPSDAGGHAT